MAATPPPLDARVRRALAAKHEPSGGYARSDGFHVAASDLGVRVRFATIRPSALALAVERDAILKGYADTLRAAGFAVTPSADRFDLVIALAVTEGRA